MQFFRFFLTLVNRLRSAVYIFSVLTIINLDLCLVGALNLREFGLEKSITFDVYEGVGTLI